VAGLNHAPLAPPGASGPLQTQPDPGEVAGFGEMLGTIFSFGTTRPARPALISCGTALGPLPLVCPAVLWRPNLEPPKTRAPRSMYGSRPRGSCKPLSPRPTQPRPPPPPVGCPPSVACHRSAGTQKLPSVPPPASGPTNGLGSGVGSARPPGEGEQPQIRQYAHAKWLIIVKQRHSERARLLIVAKTRIQIECHSKRARSLFFQNNSEYLFLPFYSSRSGAAQVAF